MRRPLAPTLVLFVVLATATGCQWNLTRDLGQGELRGQVVRLSDVGTEVATGARVEVLGTRLTTSVDTRGQFRFRGLAPGRYDLRIEENLDEEPSPELGILLRNVSIDGDGAGGSIGRDLGSVMIGSLGSIEGSIIGAPRSLVDAWVVVPSFSAQRVTEGATFRLPSLPAGTYALGVSGRDETGELVWATFDVTVKARETARLDIDLSTRPPVRDGTVTGSVAYDDGSSATGVEVGLELLGTNRVVSLGTVNEGGLYLSSGSVPAGAYTLFATDAAGVSVRFGPVLVTGETELPLLLLPRATPEDRDQDGVADDSDLCPTRFDLAQSDLDSDGVGDWCDPNADGDDVSNEQDRALVLVSGGGQSGEVGTTLALPIVVAVRDAFGQPSRADRVRFVTDGGSLGAAEVGIDTNSRASTTLVLPESVGVVTVTVTVVGTQAPPLTITATATHGPLVSAELTGLPSEMKVTQPGSLQVRLLDAFGNVVTGFSGTLAVTSSDPGAVLPASLTVVAEDGGTKEFGLEFGTEGTQSVTVSVVGNASSLAATSVLVTPPPACGDGDVDDWVGERCDDSNNVTDDCAYGPAGCTVCTSACVEGPGKAYFCGDSLTDETQGEACDDGNDVDTDDCTTACTRARCGDGFLQPWNNEACDDGNTDEADTCTSTCRVPGCGDGFTQPGEACDDGNLEDADACTATCTVARCGDGVLANTERCDDGNEVDNDNCSNACVWRFAGATPLFRGPPTITVTSNADAGPGTLRNILTNASPGSVIDFAFSGTILLNSGELLVDKELSIIGPGAGSLTINAGAFSRVMRVAATGNLFLAGVTFTGGLATTGSGGGLLNQGTAVLARVDVVSNSINDNANTGAHGGGGIRNDGTLVFADGSLANNVAAYRTGNGGGAYNTGNARFYRSIVSGNSDSNSGGPGGIMNRGTFYAENTTFRNNRANNENGGAFTQASGTSSFFQCTFDANTTRYHGGAISNVSGSNITLDRCTIVDNTATGAFSPPHAGGGLMGRHTLNSSAVVRNRHGTAADDVSDWTAGPGTLSTGFNVIGTTWASVTWGGNDVANVNPLPTFGPISGLFVPVRVPSRPSPLLDAGDPANLPTFDARGRPRVLGPTVDTGAVESAAPEVTLLAPTLVSTDRVQVNASVNAWGRATLVRWQFSTNTNFSPVLTTPFISAGNALSPVTVSYRRIGLTPGTTWYVRATVQNADGSQTSTTESFNTLPLP